MYARFGQLDSRVTTYSRTPGVRQACEQAAIVGDVGFSLVVESQKNHNRFTTESQILILDSQILFSTNYLFFSQRRKKVLN